MKKEKYIDDLINAGATDDEILEALDIATKRGDFNENIDVQPRENMYEKYGAGAALLPGRAMAMDKGAKKGSPAAIASSVGDIISIPARGIRANAAFAGTLSGGGGLQEASKSFLNTMAETKSENKGALGLLENIALDPATYIPVTKAIKGVKALSKIPKLGKALIGASAEGAKQGLASSAYEQSTEGKINPIQTAVQTGIGAGTGALAHGLTTAGGKVISDFTKKWATHNVSNKLRPGQYGAKRGFDAEEVIKNNLLGTPRETAEKSQEMLNDLNTRAKEIGKESEGTLNIDELIDNAKAQFDPESNVHNYENITSFLEGLREKYKNAYKSENIPLLKAMKLRTQIGDESAFIGRADKAGITTDPDANWKEEAFNALYGNIKDKIHEVGGDELKAINALQSKIIPIRQVAIRRMPIDEANNWISPMDALTGGLGATVGTIGALTSGDDKNNSLAKGIGAGIAVAGLRRAGGSKYATKALYNISNKLEPKIAGNLKKIADEEKAKKELSRKKKK